MCAALKTKRNCSNIRGKGKEYEKYDVWERELKVNIFVSDFAHFTDSSRGELVTLDRKSGTVEWKVEIGSPVVALFRLEGDGIVHTPFTSVSRETLNNLITHFDTSEAQSPEQKKHKEGKGETKLL